MCGRCLGLQRHLLGEKRRAQMKMALVLRICVGEIAVGKL